MDAHPTFQWKSKSSATVRQCSPTIAQNEAQQNTGHQKVKCNLRHCSEYNLLFYYSNPPICTSEPCKQLLETKKKFLDQLHNMV
ncbi:hypothetical protein T12_8999 [Trichinella patagoniensis]|uniref:Uncharacterized protein n=1 Tax=Trichinella patagoniensis TaxID=990121 RepID=A0A0V1AAM1_9BILA|nr:hypothetical protein T12_8999 [Trichinella patagoniensis]